MLMDFKFSKNLPKFWLRNKVENNFLNDLRFKAEPLVGVFEGELLDKYVVDQAKVFVCCKRTCNGSTRAASL